MKPQDFAKKWFANIDGRKFDALEEAMDTKHRFFNPMTPQPADKSGHLQMIRMMSSSLGEHVHHVDQMVADGEWVCVRGHVTCKHTGEFNGIPATGKSLDFSWIDLMRIVDGKLVEEYLEMNPVRIMEQIGAKVA